MMEDDEVAPSSSSESESEDEQTHKQLLEQVHSLAKRSREDQRTEGAATASDYHLTPALKDGAVSVESLLSGLGKVGSKALLALKKRLSQVEERNEMVEPPLNKIQADKANRRAANQESCKEVGKWVPIVKKNREAEHLSFPLQPDYIPPPSLTTKVESFTPSTELEKEVAAILAASEHAERPDQELTQAEKKSLMQMTVEEAMERRKELQKHRALVSYYEQKCRRIRRIKSKKFHKIQRRRNEKLGNKAEVTEEELVKLRVKERMTLKHSSKAKWAKKQHAREHRDPATQQALSEHHNMKTKLRQKVAEEEGSESDGTSGEGGEQEGSGSDEESGKVETSQGNPWLGTRSSVGGKTQNSGVSLSTTGSRLVIDTTPSFAISSSGDSKGGGGGGLGAASRQLLAVREAFSGDNVMEEFEREKAELQNQDTSKDTPTVLPGWGSWGGEGVRPPKRARRNKPHPPPLPRKQRKDADLKNVIIFEENKNRKIEQHLVQEVPWPYVSKDQFDKTHSTPVGRHWNTEATFRQMIRPRVSTKNGEIIEPLVLTEEVKGFIKRTKVKRNQKTNSKIAL